MDGYFRLGMVNQHKDLLKPGDQCIGGGYYQFDWTSMMMISMMTSASVKNWKLNIMSDMGGVKPFSYGHGVAIGFLEIRSKSRKSKLPFSRRGKNIREIRSVACDF